MCPTSVRYYCVPNDKRAALAPPPEDQTDTSHALASASLEQGGKRRRWGAPTEAFGPDELDALSRTCTEIACKNPNPPSASLWRHILPQEERKQQEFPDGGSQFRSLIRRMVAQSIRLGKGIPRAFKEEIFGKVAVSENASTLSLPNRLVQPIHIDVPDPDHNINTTLPPRNYAYYRRQRFQWTPRNETVGRRIVTTSLCLFHIWILLFRTPPPRTDQFSCLRSLWEN